MDRHDITSVFNQVNTIAKTDKSLFLNNSVSDLASKLQLKESTIKIFRENAEKPLTSILNDLPTDQDAFNCQPFINKLSEIVLSPTTETPLAIGIDAPWGAGKTSVMRMIENYARMLEFHCIWLNAWSLEDTNNLIAAVASEVKREGEKLSSKEQDSLIKLMRSFLKITFGTTSQLLARLSGITEVIELETDIKRKDYDKEITEIASVVSQRKSFMELIKPLLRRKKRLIVFVDDIDRALPDQIVQILKTLKLILETKGCIFVFGMDMKLVAKSIENYYRRQPTSSTISVSQVFDSNFIVPSHETIPDGFGKNYLEKMIQLHVRLPEIDYSAINNYLNTIGIAPLVIDIIHLAPRKYTATPRGLKRYINWLSITLNLIVISDLPQGLNNSLALKLIVLKRDYPQIYKELLDKSFRNLKNDQLLSEMHISVDRLYRYLNGINKRLILIFDKHLIASPILKAATLDF